jgi:RsiW-degrading membrane proteinase PrsW (M82 family)
VTGADTASTGILARSGALAIVVTIVALSVLGAIGLWDGMSFDVGVVGPTWSAIAAAVWLAYGALLLVFFIRPARRAQVLGVGVLLALAWGGLAALDIAAQANGAAETIASNASADLDETWTLVFVSPAIEETVKTLGIVLLAFLPAARRFGPAAGLVFGALVGVSFQVVENELFTVHQMFEAPDEPGLVLLEMLFIRGLVGVFSHIAYSGAIGAAIGWLLVGPASDRPRRLGVAAGVFVLMVVLHSWSNWASHEQEVIMYLLTMGVGFAVLIVTARFALSRKHEAPDTPVA